MLRRFLYHLYAAIRSHRAIDSIATALTNGDLKELSQLCGFTNYQNMCRHVDISSDMSVVQTQERSLLLQEPGLESELIKYNAEMISQLEKQLADDLEFACCSCERLHQRKKLTAFHSESKKFTSDMWEMLKTYMFMFHNFTGGNVNVTFM